MKLKHGLIITLILLPVTIVLRILQFLFAMDSAGYFVKDTALARFLGPSLYILLIVAALVLLLVMFKKPPTILTMPDILYSKPLGVLFLVLALAIAFYGGLRLGGAAGDSRFDFAAPFGILSAFFFAALGFYALGGRVKFGVFAVSGLFAPVFMSLYIITLFFESFKQIKISENKFDILSVCALALIFIMLSLVSVGAGGLTIRRLGYVLMIYCLFSSITAVSRGILAVFGVYEYAGGLDIAWSVVEFVMLIISLVLLRHIAFGTHFEPEPEGDSLQPDSCPGKVEPAYDGADADLKGAARVLKQPQNENGDVCDGAEQN